MCVISFPDLMKRHSPDNRIYTMRVGVDIWGANNILNDPLKAGEQYIWGANDPLKVGEQCSFQEIRQWCSVVKGV